MNVLAVLSESLGFIGVAVIVYGVACGVVRLVGAEAKGFRGAEAGDTRNRLRELLGYYLLLGLEFLIAADIVESIVSPSTEELWNLAIIVGIRTVISFSLNWELAQHAKRAQMEKEA